MLPVNTPLGRLRISEILDAFDGPRLLVARNAVGVAYLGLWVEDVADGDRWLYVAMSEERLEEIRGGHIPLRDAFLNAEDEIVFGIEFGRNENITRFNTLAAWDIDVADLPPEDDYLEQRPSRAVDLLPSVSPVLSASVRRRLIERLHVDSVAHDRTLGQDVVASTWSAWFACREASIRAHGLRSYTGAPGAAGATVGSFSVDLSVPRGEAYVRAVIGWAEYLRSVGSGQVHDRLARCGIDSVACEALLHNIIRFDLQFTVTLLTHLGEKEPAAAFEIDVNLAQELLRELRNAVPVLGSDKIPQADDLDRIRTTVRDLHDNGDVDSSHAGIVPRQVSYYKHAARVLGLIAPSEMLTVAGRRLVSARSRSERNEILRSQFAASECGWAWARWAGVRSLSDVEADSAEAFLREVVPSLSLSTAHRRARTLAAWYQQLFTSPVQD